MGFTLVEIMVVVVITGILVSLTIPSIHSIRQKTQATITARDLQTLANTLEQVSLDNGAWPAMSTTTMPPELAGAIQIRVWNDGPVTGGQYYWYYFDGVGAILAVINSTATAEQMQIIDGTLDDGFAGFGDFTYSPSGVMVWWLERP